MPQMLIYAGSKTFPSILTGNKDFVTEAKKHDAKPIFKILKGKKHIGMITQFFNTSNPRYDEIKDFMKQNSEPKTEGQVRKGCISNCRS